MYPKISDRFRLSGRRGPIFLRTRMQDYARLGLQLFWQRITIYSTAFLLEVFYYSEILALITLVVLVISESVDNYVYKRILRMERSDVLEMRRCLRLLHFATVLSATLICGFAVSIAQMQGHTTHFMPLFFLFAAALFASMNNHHVRSALALRLVIYFVTFLFIPLYDIWMTQAPLSSELWAQFFTSVFVMGFVADCSRVFSGMYRENLRQMEALQQEHQKVQAALSVKENFLATVSHELRTPLTSIKGSLDLIGYGALGEVPERMSKPLAIAQRNAARLAALINDLLDLQKMEAGKMQYNFTKINVASFLSQTLATNQPFAQNLNVQIELEPVCDDIWVMADENRLDQVLSNILSNAAKFSQAGQTVVISATPSDDTVRLSVVDEGVGLSEDDRKTVFEEFSQVDSSDRRKVGGTGLGLNISKKIIEAHSGKIDYFRNEAVGTTFYVDLPQVDGPEHDATATGCEQPTALATPIRPLSPSMGQSRD